MKMLSVCCNCQIHITSSKYIFITFLTGDSKLDPIYESSGYGTNLAIYDSPYSVEQAELRFSVFQTLTTTVICPIMEDPAEKIKKDK